MKQSKFNFLVFLLLGVLIVTPNLLLAQQNAEQILTELSTQTTAASTQVRAIIRTICWILMGVGILMMIYFAIADSQRLKIGIITFVAAALILTVGSVTGLL